MITPRLPLGPRISKSLEPMSDERAKVFRDDLIARGIITPSEYSYGPYERPFMTKAVIERLKERLVRHGMLTPRPPRVYTGTTIIH